MGKHEIQRKIYRIVAVILMVSILSLIAVIPGILQDSSTGTRLRAVIGTLIGIGIHLLLVLIFLRATRSNRSERRINREIHLFWALGMIFLGFIMMDGAFAFLDDVLYVSIGMFLVVFCDFVAALVFVTALFLLRKNKKA
jgi:dolichol kinase